MADRVVFPHETPQIAEAVYKQLIKLRTTPIKTVIANLKRFLTDDKSIQVALVLINDDPAQMRVVAHLPTVIFEDLKAARLISSRMEEKVREAARPIAESSITREEFNTLAGLVKEMPELIVQAREAVLIEMKTENASTERHRSAQSVDHQTVLEVLSKMLGKMDSFVELDKGIRSSMQQIMNGLSKVYNLLSGFSQASGYKDPQVTIEQGIARALGGNHRR